MPLALAGSARVAAAEPAGKLVKIELMADRSAVAPGEKLTLALRFQVAEGWHIYWENPGEAGLATEVTFTAPAGYEVGPVRYPGPIRFQTPGETAASYGYTGAPMLSAQVGAPRGGRGGPVRFSAQASWLACRDVCLRGQGSASLELAAGRARPAHAELFARHAAELPRRQSELGAAARWERDATGARLLLTVKRADKIEYFPPSGEDLHMVAQETAPARGATELRLTYKPGFQPARARGVLAVTRGADRRYYALNLEEAR
jgi:thiol:disulfide interchange protein DsbD